MHTVTVHRTTSPTAHYSGLGTDHNSSRSGGFKLEALRVQLLRPFVILRLVGFFFPVKSLLSHQVGTETVPSSPASQIDWHYPFSGSSLEMKNLFSFQQFRF